MSFSRIDRLLIATRNAGKIRELEHLLSGSGIGVVPLSEHPEVPEVEEDADSFLGNAVKKAAAAAAASGIPSLADDSGLEVEALGGRPGVHSARFSGPGATDAANNRKLLAELENVPEGKRGARFRCVVALCLPSGECV
ncbi:MAG TPA: non-canonical purine NTP pyrophosphatase, partial [Verrucomicrobiae bacterium]|nr:non-canonical purine NTP pyrophosphatase [Verrucomicrobiae bacterium]